MAKLTVAFALCHVYSGKLGSTVLWTRPYDAVAMRKRYSAQKNSSAQRSWREKYRQVDWIWSNLPESHRNLWRNQPWKKGWSNYAFFMHQNLKRIRAGLSPILEPAV